MRTMELADRHGFPLVTLVDTPGAYPGIAAEQHGQGGAIARSQAVMLRLGVPTVAVVIGEGGSGGAIAIAVADRVLMQENAIYSVISPEGCASILWRDAAQAKKAASAFKPDAAHCLELGVIDGIVPEPEGGAQVDHDGRRCAPARGAARPPRRARGRPADELRRARRAKFRSMGVLASRLRPHRGSPHFPQAYPPTGLPRFAGIFVGPVETMLRTDRVECGIIGTMTGLSDYRRKRDPRRTPEPFGGGGTRRMRRASSSSVTTPGASTTTFGSSGTGR